MKILLAVIAFITAGAVGGVLSTAGITNTDWQFWAILGLVLALVLELLFLVLP